MQIGCDPKADSTIQLRHGKEIPTVLEMFQQKKQNLKLEDMVTVGYAGVKDVTAGELCRGLYDLLGSIELSQQTFSVVKKA